MHARWFPAKLESRRAWTLRELTRLIEESPSDIRAHVPRLRALASHSRDVVELGVRHGVSTVALLSGRPEALLSVDVHRPETLAVLESVAESPFTFRQADSRSARIGRPDLLVIDTEHTYAQLSAELTRHGPSVRRWIAVHDTTTFGLAGADGGPGLWRAVEEFLAGGGWRVAEHNPEDNGLTLLERTGPN